MSATRYAGSCQCGGVRFGVTLDLERTTTCNCSRCSRLGWIMCFAPLDDFAVEAGEDLLTEYTFNREVIRHQFCSTCGIEPFARGISPKGGAVAAVNVRCLDGVDLDRLNPVRFDGKSL